MRDAEEQADRRRVGLTRLRKARFVARNERGGELEFGEGDDAAFSPVELLLAAIAGCNAIDVDYITAKREEAERFDVDVSARKIRDEHGNRLVDIVLRFDVCFADTEGGAAAREVLPAAVRRSRDKLCTVGRTVVVGTPVTVTVEGMTETAQPPR
jgi:putative redox protein